jgi:hypothetical protein
MIVPKDDLLKMRGGSEKQLADTILDLMIEFKTWDIGKMPIPTFIGIVKRMEEHKKEMEREMKWSKR